MKNVIKIIVIFGIVTSFFPVYPMTEPVAYEIMGPRVHEIMEPHSYCVGLHDLDQKNPFLDMNDLNIWYHGDDLLSYVSSNIPSNHSLRADGGLPLMLAALQIDRTEDSGRKEEILETIYDALCKGRRITSDYVVQKNKNPDIADIRPCKKSTPIFKSVESLLYCLPSVCGISSTNNKVLWIQAICEGHRERQAKFDCTIDEEDTRLIEEAEQKFYKEEVERKRYEDSERKFFEKLASDETSTYCKKIIEDVVDYARRKPRQIGLTLISVPILCYFLIN